MPASTVQLLTMPVIQAIYCWPDAHVIGAHQGMSVDACQTKSMPHCLDNKSLLGANGLLVAQMLECCDPGGFPLLVSAVFGICFQIINRVPTKLVKCSEQAGLCILFQQVCRSPPMALASTWTGQNPCIAHTHHTWPA